LGLAQAVNDREQSMGYKTCFAIIGVLCVSAPGALIRDSAYLAQAEEPKKSATKPVPFKLAKPDKPLILLETTVNDRGPYRFVLDTGAGGTIITPKLAKELGVKPDGRESPDKATGAGGQVDIRMGMVKSLQIGETRLEELQVGIMDLAGVSKVVETDLDGIIGYNFLKKFRVVIDYPKRTVTFE
jgi:predicted aspartyl protease